MTSGLFDFQPNLTSTSFALRALRASDFSQMHACASDPKIWAGHPAHDRYKESVFKKVFEDAMHTQACLVISEISTGKLIGWSRFYVAEDSPNDIAIGHTFLSRDHWGGASNNEIKHLMLNYAFVHFNKVWFHVSPSNIRSQKAVLKLGAALINESLMYIAGAQGMWQSYVIRKQDWLRA